MRFVFKTDYDQDIRILKHSGYWWSYGVLLAALIAQISDTTRLTGMPM